MSHHGMGSIPCQEAHLGIEAQKRYSHLDILLAAHIFGGKRYCPTFYWFHSASAQGSTSSLTTSSSVSRAVGLRVIFFLWPNMIKSVETITFHIFFMLLNTFSPTMYVLCLYINRIVAIAGYNPRFI